MTTVSEPDRYIIPVWWHRNWIPITSDQCGNLECIDLAPGPRGTHGQIIDFDHETIDRTVISDSFGDWVADYVREVVAGAYLYSEDHGFLMRKDEL